MLHNFINVRKRLSKQMRKQQSREDYFEESGKLFQTMLYFMKEAKVYGT